MHGRALAEMQTSRPTLADRFEFSLRSPHNRRLAVLPRPPHLGTRWQASTSTVAAVPSSCAAGSRHTCIRNDTIRHTAVPRTITLPSSSTPAGHSRAAAAPAGGKAAASPARPSLRGAAPPPAVASLPRTGRGAGVPRDRHRGGGGQHRTDQGEARRTRAAAGGAPAARQRPVAGVAPQQQQ